jgi:4'-phosphopantetheinyl transferase
VGPGEVHVWQIALDPSAGLADCLSRDERERAARFRFEVHRRRYRVAHIALREVLSRYADAPPAGLCFKPGANGKPALAPPAVHFNLTHSRDLGLVAVAPAPIGIDVEYLDPRTDCEALTRRVASGPEREAIARCPEALRRAAFFRLWTRKEAYIKGRGLGLSLPLQAITVPVTALAGPAEVRVEARWDDGRPWRLWGLEVPAGHEASLCYAATVDRLRRYEWPAGGQAPVRG